ncbi:hypothetical protein Tco_1070567, partial [Tanacetum coccineum]
MRSDELYKFSDDTLTRLLSSLEDITKNIDMTYLPKRRWSILENKRAHFMIKDINKLLKERRTMRSLEKFVGDSNSLVPLIVLSASTVPIMKNNDMDPKSVDSFEELSQKFLKEFSQQNSYAKDPIKIHGIKRRQNKGLQAFMDRFKSESSHIKEVPPILRISAFMHGHGHPKLAKKLNDKIPKTVDEMFERVRAFIRGEVVTGSAEMVRPSQGDKGGHNTNDCYQLKKKIEEAVALGKLAHLVNDIRRNNQRNENQGRNSVKILDMIREGGNRKRPFEE